MITVETYIELPEVYEDTNAAVEDIIALYGRWDWQAICDVAYLSPQGAVVDIDDTLGDLYFDPELQTFLFRVEAQREVDIASSLVVDTPDGVPVAKAFKDTRTETYEKYRAISFLRQEDEDAPQS